ncbi:phage tail protein [Bifidobacterium sp.]|uniref:phage tail protein n=1 Tax=Bifidobacterium sp. TaxID=41200 RepID=UPI0039ED3BA1
MSMIVDFKQVSVEGLESSPYAEALAGVRANEARYHWNKYQHRFTVTPAEESEETLEYVNHVLEEERGLKFASLPLQTSRFQVASLNMAYVFYQSGLSVNVMYSLDPEGKRAVGFKLCEGMEVPAELADRFKFARQKSKLAGTIRGSYFVIKNEYPVMEERA